MSYCQSEITLRQLPRELEFSPIFATLSVSIIVPVFCACMISAMGSIAGIRQTVSMQFDVDADTEHITVINTAMINTQQKTVEKNT